MILAPPPLCRLFYANCCSTLYPPPPPPTPNNFYLQVTHEEALPQNIEYTVTRSPRFGSLLLTSNREAQRFTQQDIDRGQIGVR